MLDTPTDLAENAVPTLQDVAKAKHNPFTETINLPIEAATGFGIGPHHDIGEELSIQALVSGRTIVPLEPSSASR